MSEKIIALLMWLIGSGVRGYASVVVLMAIQSACIPLPSEVIMPLAGVALVQPLGMTPMQIQMQLFLLATVASLASNLGSIPRDGPALCIVTPSLCPNRSVAEVLCSERASP